MGLIQKVFGTHSQHELKRIYPIVDHIEALEPEMQKLSDEELSDKTRGSSKIHRNETLPCTADRRYCPSSGTYFRDEDR